MHQYLSNVAAWIAETWKVWLIFSIAVMLGWTLYWYLLVQRAYRAIDGKAQVRHGRLGKWRDLEEHLKEHHIEM